MELTRAPKRLLDRYPIIRSANVAEIEHTILGIYGARRFNVVGRGSRLQVHANYWRSPGVALSFGRNDGAEIEASYSGVCYFRQHFAISGSTSLRIGRRQHEISPSSSCLVPAGEPLGLKFAPGFENLVFRIDRAFLADKAAAAIGQSEPSLQPLPGLQSCPAGAARLERLIRFLVAEMERGDVPQLFITEMEQALAAAFLCANPQLLGKAASQKPSSIAHRELRMAEDYIEANWDKPLAFETLAAITNVSARTLFYYFRKLHGKTPMQYLKAVRLRHARQMLQQSPQMKVTEVAFACGFGNLGHFARDYQEAWGERPSETRRVHGYKN